MVEFNREWFESLFRMFIFATLIMVAYYIGLEQGYKYVSYFAYLNDKGCQIYKVADYQGSDYTVECEKREDYGWTTEDN